MFRCHILLKKPINANDLKSLEKTAKIWEWRIEEKNGLLYLLKKHNIRRALESELSNMVRRIELIQIPIQFKEIESI